MYSKLYSKFIAANHGIQHFAAHSHHFWPDLTLEAMNEYWYDSAQLCADKWDYIFEEKFVQTAKSISLILNIEDSKRIVFGASVGEFLFKIISAIEYGSIDENSAEKKYQPRVLTTDGESPSCDYLLRRLKEAGVIDLKKIPTQPFNSFRTRMHAELKGDHYDVVFMSHVFSNSGFTAPVDAIATTCAELKIDFILDATFSFLALPFDFSKYASTSFLVAGCEGFSQAGEGCAFLYSPPTSASLRPRLTSWFGDKLTKNGSEYLLRQSRDGWQLASLAFDMSGLYRLNAILRKFRRLNIDSIQIHDYVFSLQKAFLSELETTKSRLINVENLLLHDLENHGHIFAFEFFQTDRAQLICRHLKRSGIIADTIGSRLRFGFGIYQTAPFDLAAINTIV